MQHDAFSLISPFVNGNSHGLTIRPCCFRGQISHIFETYDPTAHLIIAHWPDKAADRSPLIRLGAGEISVSFTKGTDDPHLYQPQQRNPPAIRCERRLPQRQTRALLSRPGHMTWARPLRRPGSSRDIWGRDREQRRRHGPSYCQPQETCSRALKSTHTHTHTHKHTPSHTHTHTHTHSHTHTHTHAHTHTEAYQMHKNTLSM